MRRRIVDALLAATSLMALCAIILTIDGRAGDQMARFVTKSVATNGGIAVQFRDGMMQITRSAWDLSYVYGPLMMFAGVAAILVLCMIRTK